MQYLRLEPFFFAISAMQQDCHHIAAQQCLHLLAECMALHSSSQDSCSDHLVMQVKYNERFYEELHLPVEKLSFSKTKPQPFAAEQAAVHSCPSVARPVLQQEGHTPASQDTFQVHAFLPDPVMTFSH